MAKIKQILIHFLISEIIIVLGLLLFGLCGFFFRKTNFIYEINNNNLTVIFFGLFFLFLILSKTNFILVMIINIILFAVGNLKDRFILIFSSISFCFLLKTIFFMRTHENDYSDYENWQYYNHQAILSTKLDYFIGKNFINLQIVFIVLLIHLSISIFKSIKLYIQRDNV